MKIHLDIDWFKVKKERKIILFEHKLRWQNKYIQINLWCVFIDWYERGSIGYVGATVCQWCGCVECFCFVFVWNKPIMLADLLDSSFFVRFGALTNWSTSMQFNSSDRSMQSLTPSQTIVTGMQSRFIVLHWNSSGWHPLWLGSWPDYEFYEFFYRVMYQSYRGAMVGGICVCVCVCVRSISFLNLYRAWAM